VSVEGLLGDAPLVVRWIPFPLHPETPEEGRELADLFAGRGVDVSAMLVRLRAVADGLGLPLGERTRTYNSRRAQELGRWAESLGRGAAFRTAAFRAYFAEGRNIALPEELERIAASAGLPEPEVRPVLDAGAFAAAVDRDWAEARARGVTAVPTHLFRGRAAAGYLPAEDLRAFVGGVG